LRHLFLWVVSKGAFFRQPFFRGESHAQKSRLLSA
jgi:hypothetical protein